MKNEFQEIMCNMVRFPFREMALFACRTNFEFSSLCECDVNLHDLFISKINVNNENWTLFKTATARTVRSLQHELYSCHFSVHLIECQKCDTSPVVSYVENIPTKYNLMPLDLHGVFANFPSVEYLWIIFPDKNHL